MCGLSFQRIPAAATHDTVEHTTEKPLSGCGMLRPADSQQPGQQSSVISKQTTSTVGALEPPAARAGWATDDTLLPPLRERRSDDEPLELRGSSIGGRVAGRHRVVPGFEPGAFGPIAGVGRWPMGAGFERLGTGIALSGVHRGLACRDCRRTFVVFLARLATDNRWVRHIAEVSPHPHNRRAPGVADRAGDPPRRPFRARARAPLPPPAR